MMATGCVGEGCTAEEATLASSAVHPSPTQPVAIIGAPLDLGQDRRGVDMGPSAIRYAGLERRIEALGRECADWGNVPTPVAEAEAEGDEELRFLEQIKATCGEVATLVRRAGEEGYLPLVLGGDHSVALGTLAGLRNDGPGGVLWVDAHSDINTPETSPSGNVHGMALAVVEEPCPNECHPLGVDRGQRPHLALEARPCEAERRGERHPVDVPARARLGCVDVRVRVDPENATWAVHRREPSERAQRDRVISAEHERHRPTSGHLGDASSDQFTRVVDLGEKARAFVPESGRLGDRGLDVPLVVHRVAEADESLLETRVPDRGGAHVDAASPLPEVERRADDRDLSLRAHAQNLTAAAATLVAAAR